jgi:hypothetical protein
MYISQLFSFQHGKWGFFFLSATPPESQIGSVGEVRTQSQTVTCLIPAKLDIRFSFYGHPWIPKLLYKILNIVMYILIIIESNAYPINANCRKCYQCELNMELVWLWVQTFPTDPIWLSGGTALKRKKNCFLHWNENSCNSKMRIEGTEH